MRFVLQVRTLLENPTRYHVVQKQKHQVRQYLHESFRNPSELSSLADSALASSIATLDDHPMTLQQVNSYPQVHPTGFNQIQQQGFETSPDLRSETMSPGLSSIATTNSEVISLF